MPGASAEIGSAANSYEILAKLATGGMAEIFLARGASGGGVERFVVLKRVLRERASDGEFVRMFLDEARLAAQLQHPNIAQVYDIGKLGDSYFFTMEYVHGETVRALLHRAHSLQVPVPIASVLAVAAGAAAGLHHAHERIGLDGQPLGIVHRDVSPSNLMVSYEGHVKLVDFGVAKAAHRSQETRSGSIKGKIAYLSPEQCRGRPVDRRSDLFSLGIVIWEMLTTRRLYRYASDFETMHAIVSLDVPPPSAFRPEVPPALDALVLRALAKEPEARFATADEVLEAIEALAVATGTALTAASLGRLMRQLFGPRPEPWVEVREHEPKSEAFTVTAEPIPQELFVSGGGEIDRKLDAVPDLSLTPSATDDGVQAAAVPLPVVAPRPPPMAAAPRAPAPSAAPRWRMMRAVLVASAIVIGVLAAYAWRARQPSDASHDQAGAPTGSAPPGVAAASRPAVDAAEPAHAVSRDAAIAVASAPRDAAELPDAEATPAEPAHSRHVHHEADRSVGARFRAGHYAAVVRACAASSAVVASEPDDCILAACRAHDAAHARRWLASAGSKRAVLETACANAGTSLEQEKPHPDCSADPLACQH